MHSVRDDVMVVAANLDTRRGDARRRSTPPSAASESVDLVVHGAARTDAAAFGTAAETGPAVVEAQLSPKIRGLFHLMEAFRGREPARWVLHSSISTVLGGLGLARLRRRQCGARCDRRSAAATGG